MARKKQQNHALNMRGFTHVIMRDAFVFERQFDDRVEAEKYLRYLRQNYGENHSFELKTVPDKLFMEMLNSVTNPEYQNAVGSARR